VKKLNTSNSRALESYKLFPYVAWTVIIGFTFFVYGIAMELKAVATTLQNQTQNLQDITTLNQQEFQKADLNKINSD
jgi:cell division protein FtsN